MDMERQLLYGSTMKHTISTLLLLAAVAATPACGKKDSDAKGTAKSTEPKAGGDSKKADPEPAKASTIEALKLAYDGPAGESMKMGDDYMIQASGLVFTVGTPKEPKTLETAVEDSKMYDGSKITVQEKTADGYHLEYNNTGSMGANYFVEVLRTINGTAYACGTTAPDADTAAAAVKACQSLRAI
jgi:hypothetical protein